MFTPFKRLFAPVFQSPMSKNFRFSSFLGIYKEVVSDLKTFAYKGCKIGAQKKFFFDEFCLSSRILLVLVVLSASVRRFFVSCMRYSFILLIDIFLADFYSKVLKLNLNFYLFHTQYYKLTRTFMCGATLKNRYKC